MTRQVVAGPFLQGLDVPESARRLRGTEVSPGMLSYFERALLTNLVARTWRGAGAIVDGGSFMGSSIVAAAEGIRASGVLDEAALGRFPAGKPIHGYERGAAMRRHELGYLPGPGEKARVWNGVEYRVGESFVPVLESAVAPYRDLVALHIGDLTEQTWPDAPIEVAFIDVCKTAELNVHVAREFYPALIPGGSTLINQDFFNDRLPWIKVTMGHLRDFFTWEGQVAESSVYRNVTAVPVEVAAYDPFLEGTAEECLALHDAVEFPGLDRKFAFRLRISRAYLLAFKGRKDDALDLLREVRSTYADQLGDVDADRGQQYRYDRAWKEIRVSR